MCIIFVAHRAHPKYPLIIASNRDEFLDRPTQPMKIWAPEDYDLIGSYTNGTSDNSEQQNTSNRKHGHRRLSLAGRDLVSGGTWLGIALPLDKGEDDGDIDGSDPIDDDDDSVRLRWIAITNYHDMDQHGRRSRGELLMEYLDGKFPSAPKFLSGVQPRGQDYNGFNLLVGDKSDIYYYGNRLEKEQLSKRPQPLTNGIYGLGNDLLDSSWPKVQRGKELLRSLCQEDAKEQSTSSVETFHEQLMNILCDQTQPTSDVQIPQIDKELPSTRYLTSIFMPKELMSGKDYGTRSSTTIVVERDGKVSVLERTWPSGEDRWFRFDSKKGCIDRLEGMLVAQPSFAESDSQQSGGYAP